MEQSATSIENQFILISAVLHATPEDIFVLQISLSTSFAIPPPHLPTPQRYEHAMHRDTAAPYLTNSHYHYHHHHQGRRRIAYAADMNTAPG